MAPFTSKLRSALHFRYLIVIPRFILRANTADPNIHYNHGFHNTFDYNHFQGSYAVIKAIKVITKENSNFMAI